MLIKNYLQALPRVELVGAVTPIQHLRRLSEYLQRDIYIKRDDLSYLGMGGNKLRKLEFLAADALKQGCDTLVTAGAIQSNHVRQTAATAAHLGLKCAALLENPIATDAPNYLANGNYLLSSMMGCRLENVEALSDPDAQLQAFSERLARGGAKPYVIPVGGSNALGSLGYVDCALEIAEQCARMDLNIGSLVVPSGSAGTHAGLAVGFAHCRPDIAVVGVTVSRLASDQLPKVVTLQNELSARLNMMTSSPITLWDDYFAPRYGTPNREGMRAVELLASLEGIMLDPVYTGKAMAGLIDGVQKSRFSGSGPLMFIHTGGAPALFAYCPQV
ncbi:D-cysteine desulfhydrase [Raoultella terrigena]|uniref:D-cysteine desulfhydrase n=1 Tax=Raoultella terrigena TaxID=577 RepID=UPI000DFCF877|nr:D-cysteine desulfhydrase [Raoultella terrigena]SUQ57604.1 D-cysteine desulfhydrase [Raoultella terrigena]